MIAILLEQTLFKAPRYTSLFNQLVETGIGV